jgi:hypothetical protein
MNELGLRPQEQGLLEMRANVFPTVDLKNMISTDFAKGLFT